MTLTSASNSAKMRVFQNLIWPLEKRFTWKCSQDQADEAMADMVDAFASYSAEELASAAAYIRQHRKFTTMPTVGDIHAVLDEIREAQKPKAAKAGSTGVALTLDEFKHRMVQETIDAKEWAKDWLVRSDLGRESIRSGWCRDLFNLVWQIRRARVRKNDLNETILDEDLSTIDTPAKDVLRAIRKPARNPDYEAFLLFAKDGRMSIEGFAREVLGHG